MSGAARPQPMARAGSLAGAFLLVQSVAGILGPSAVGAWFDVTGSKSGLFVLLAMFLAAAFALFATLAPGFGEAAAPVAMSLDDPREAVA